MANPFDFRDIKLGSTLAYAIPAFLILLITWDTGHPFGMAIRAIAIFLIFWAIFSVLMSWYIKDDDWTELRWLEDEERFLEKGQRDQLRFLEERKYGKAYVIRKYKPQKPRITSDGDRRS